MLVGRIGALQEMWLDMDWGPRGPARGLDEKGWRTEGDPSGDLGFIGSDGRELPAPSPGLRQEICEGLLGDDRPATARATEMTAPSRGVDSTARQKGRIVRRE